MARIPLLIPAPLLTASLRSSAPTLTVPACVSVRAASIRLWAPTLIAFVIIISSPRNCGYIVYVTAFAYLIFW